MNSKYVMRAQAWKALRENMKVLFPLMLLSVILADGFGIKLIYQYLFSQEIDLPFNYWGEQLTLKFAMPVGFGRVLVVAAFAFSLIGLYTSVGEHIIACKILRGDKYGVKDLFPSGVFGKAILMNVVQYLLIALGSMLFIVPGIVLACSYAESNYLLANDPSLGPIEALRKSRSHMQGKKLMLFVYIIGFIPWILIRSLVMELVFQMVGNMGWTGDLIYTIISWALTGVLLAYLRIGMVRFFNEIAAIPAFDPEAEAKRAAEEVEAERAAAEEERKREEKNAQLAEYLYYENGCSRERLNRNGLLERYEKLGLSQYRENYLREAYARELMQRFDSDPNTINDIVSLCREYAMDNLADRAIARIQRYAREGLIPQMQVLDMAKQMLGMLHSGAFSENPGFAARKQTDILNIAESIHEKAADLDPDGEWLPVYNEICDMCGIEA